MRALAIILILSAGIAGAFVAYDRFHDSGSETRTRGAPATAAATTAPTAAAPAPRTEWSIRERKDQMSDEVTRSAYREVSADGGYTVALQASCIPAPEKGAQANLPGMMNVLVSGLIGYSGNHMAVGFKVSRDGKPIPLQYKTRRDPKTGEISKDLTIRYRLDDGKAQMASTLVTSDYEALLMFGNSLLFKDTIGGFGELFALFTDISPDTALSVPIGVLSIAKRLRVEIPLADGAALVFDLLPQDPALQSVAQNCGFQICRMAGGRGSDGNLPFLYKDKDSAGSGAGWYVQPGALLATGFNARDARGKAIVQVRVSDLFLSNAADAEPENVRKHLAQVGTRGWMYSEYLNETRMLCYGG